MIGEWGTLNLKLHEDYGFESFVMTDGHIAGAVCKGGIGGGWIVSPGAKRFPAQCLAKREVETIAESRHWFLNRDQSAIV